MGSFKAQADRPKRLLMNSSLHRAVCAAGGPPRRAVLNRGRGKVHANAVDVRPTRAWLRILPSRKAGLQISRVIPSDM